MAQGFINTTTGGQARPNSLPAVNTDVDVNIKSAIPAGTAHIGSVSIDGSVSGNFVLGDSAAQIGVVTVGNQLTIANAAPITGIDFSGAARTVATDSRGALIASQTVPTHNTVFVEAGKSNTLLSANDQRLSYIIQLTGSIDILVNETGASITSMNDDGIFVYSFGNPGSLYSPILVSNSAVTATASANTTVRIVEYSRV